MVDLMAEGVGSFVDGRWIGGTPFEVERPADCSTVCTAASASPSASSRRSTGPVGPLTAMSGPAPTRPEAETSRAGSAVSAGARASAGTRS